MGLPHVCDAQGTEMITQLDIRFALDLYAGVRPIKTWFGLTTPLADPRAAHIDMVLVRENTDGLFYARGRGVIDGEGESAAAYDTMSISCKGTARVVDFAMRLTEQRQARGRSGPLTNVNKANAFRSMAFWREVFVERAARFPQITKEHTYVDAMALNLVLKPWTYDVLVTENMFGDILSDLIASLVGRMGMALSGDIGDDHGLFQPAHGTAPDIAGRGISNPTAMILSAAMMLEWLGEHHADAALLDGASLIEGAVRKAFLEQVVRPYDFGGRSSPGRSPPLALATLQRISCRPSKAWVCSESACAILTPPRPTRWHSGSVWSR